MKEFASHLGSDRGEIKPNPCLSLIVNPNLVVTYLALMVFVTLISAVMYARDLWYVLGFICVCPMYDNRFYGLGNFS